LHTAFPLLVERIPETNIDCVAFPDDGAEKRFSKLFKKSLPGLELITCGKKRDRNDPSKRTVVIKDGDAYGKHVVIVDDMIRSGGTMFEAAKALKRHGAVSVSVFSSHGCFPNESYKRFLKGGDRSSVFDKIWVTNSNPVPIQNIPEDECIEILDISDLIIKDL
jgi:phosphoribosylpyrophosphate synthetase